MSIKFAEYVQQIDTSKIKSLYNKADLAIKMAMDWDKKTNNPPLFSNVNAVVNLDGRNYGLFNSELQKQYLLKKGDIKQFPNNMMSKYPELENELAKYPIMINVKLILKNSHDENEILKTIGGVAVHEATHAQDYYSQIGKNNPQLSEDLPERNRKKFEDWFDQRSIMTNSPYSSATINKLSSSLNAI